MIARVADDRPPSSNMILPQRLEVGNATVPRRDLCSEVRHLWIRLTVLDVQ